jgi:hypothetical protein
MNGSKLVDSHDNDPYWTDGEKVYYTNTEIKKADLSSFIIFPENAPWAKDKNTVYRYSRPFKEADVDTFETLNYSFVKDKLNIWTLNGKITKIDMETFEVCDCGKVFITNNDLHERVFKIFKSIGYCKDKNNVYYYIGDDVMAYKIKPVNGATPETFISIGDCCFGYDEKAVYYKNKILKKADPNTWKLFRTGCFYSKDKKIYYKENIIKEADVETFEIIHDTFARDKNNYYNTDNVMSKEEYESFIIELKK